MCGIAGILGKLGDANRAALARMSAALVHRGPDADGTWESTPDAEGRGAMLAHRRLAILDLSPAGAQPMTDPVTGHVVAYNGEIYDYAELRRRLEAEGHAFASSGDTAVMLRALAVHGDEALGWLRGMFVFALWNPAARTLRLARDPLGIKPLYVARRREPGGDWSIAFASELRALLASGLLGTPRLDPGAVASVVWNGFVVGPGTAVEGVELLWPGRAVEFGPDGAERRAVDFWSIPGAPARRPTTEADLARAIEHDVELHLASDVPLAVFLSGGIDSSAVANLAQRVARTPVHTFTLAFEEQELNEGPIARRIAEAIGTQHQEVVLTEGHFVEHLEAALDSLDQPTFDGLNSYYLSHAIRSAGFTVALAGTGGDELFGGYTSFRDLPVLQRLSQRLGWVPLGLRVAAATVGTAPLRRGRGATPPQTRWAKLPEMVRRGADLSGLYQLAYALFLPGFQRELVGEGTVAALRDGLPPAMRARLDAETGSRSALSALSVLEQRLFLGERLLRDNDVASMAASLEQRVPLVDQALFECVDALPDDLRYSPIGKKALLRRVGLRGLDPALFDRPKSGFVLPFDRWIRRGLRTAMDEAMRDAAAVRQAGLDPDAVGRLWRAFLDGAPGIYWSRVWSVYVLIRWCHRHRVLA
ncbi:asparagine synthase (glutamine-hydrolyzing) [Anaeromyxobacter dehalogenans]|uniref:asparagine synthase (glutamine-hydrolyzing) n=1 Tax=Anaeromyxobacter dehalogenans (strain 2CP-C) TaxID=290397 RepID=Q2ILL8_ANADE|nr:asparagine synthase (glutamine-hydrolyzing) [Anaeromyxobacter dehalogenans]ABC82550.1 Asparagine synthase, glutamine-hydrolyzing [Anaeromyxobacter dehalogenans 2CP-C]